MGIFSSANFNGPNLEGPDALDGLQYGITSAVDDPTTGNATVTGNYQLIKNSVTFLLDIPDGANFDLSNINNVVFQYGTALADPQLGGSCSGSDCGGGSTVPEPTSLLLLGSGIAVLGVAALRRKKN